MHVQSKSSQPTGTQAAADRHGVRGTTAALQGHSAGALLCSGGSGIPAEQRTLVDRGPRDYLDALLLAIF